MLEDLLRIGSEIGLTKINSVISDGASNCIKMKQELEKANYKNFI